MNLLMRATASMKTSPPWHAPADQTEMLAEDELTTIL